MQTLDKNLIDDTIIKLIDKNNDGLIDFKEFVINRTKNTKKYKKKDL